MSSNSTVDPAAATSSSLHNDKHPFVQFNGLVNGAWFVFLIVSVASARLGGLVRYLGMPLITGYMFIGVIAGPFVLNIVHNSDIADLAWVTQTALAYIAFSAGSELYLPELRSLFKPIIALTVTTSTVTYLGCSFLIFAMSSSSALMDWMGEYPPECRLMISLIIGSIMVARSPASAIAVVRELNAHGRLTSCMLGVTVVGDVVVLLLFALSSSLALAVCSSDGFRGAEFLYTILSLMAAIGFGYLFGYLFILLLWMPRAPWAKYTILPCGLLIFMLASWFEKYTSIEWGVAVNFDALLICITAGYVVTNRSDNRITFMMMLGRYSSLVFVPFFCLVGCSLNLTVLYQSIGFAVVVFFVRAACMFLGGWTGGKVGGLSKDHCQTVWLTMLSQAGVSLGLASEVSVKFATSFGPDCQTAVVAVVIINQLVGPLLCKYALKRANEAGRLGPDGLPLEEGAGLDDAPDLQLSYDLDDGGDDTTSGDTTNRGAGSGALHRRVRTRGSMSFVPGSHVLNIHGARFRKVARRRLLVIGIDSHTLAAAQRLLDSESGVEGWSVVMIDENANACKRAETLLNACSASKTAREAVFDPLPSLLRKMGALASRTTARLESGLDSILPTNQDASDFDRLVDASGNAISTPAKLRSISASPDEHISHPASPSGAPTGGMAHRHPNHPGFGELQVDDDEDDGLADVSLQHIRPDGLVDSDALDSDMVNSAPTSPRPQAGSPTAAAGASMSRVQIHQLNILGHRTFLDAYRAVEEDLFLSREGVDAILLSLHMDSVSYDVAAYLTDRRRFSRVVARIKHPGWGRVLSGLGVTPIYHLSVEAQLVSQMLNGPNGVGPERDATSSALSIPFVTSASLFDFSSDFTAKAAASISASELVASTVRGEDDLLCAMQDLDSHQQSEFARVNSPPPSHLQSEALKRTMSRPHFMSVVSEAHRDGYMNAILNLHSHTTSPTAASESDAQQRQVQQLQFSGGIGALRHQQQMQRGDRAAAATAAGVVASATTMATATTASPRRPSAIISPSGAASSSMPEAL